MFSTGIAPRPSPGASTLIPGLAIRRYTDTEPRRPGVAFGLTLRCWNCGTPIGEKKGSTFLVSSNKVEVGGIPLAASVWRRCRGGKANPACRAVNALPEEWVRLPPLQ